MPHMRVCQMEGTDNLASIWQLESTQQKDFHYIP